MCLSRVVAVEYAAGATPTVTEVDAEVVPK